MARNSSAVTVTVIALGRGIIVTSGKFEDIPVLLRKIKAPVGMLKTNMLFEEIKQLWVH